MSARPFDTLLVANRGEIACRVIATCKRLGIRSVAVYSEADAHARHVRLADVAVPIGPAAARESYLVVDKILAAAKQTGAQAIHPGYGFLSENAEFARACDQAGIVFIGPPASAIEAMGDKSAAKALMQKAGVPLTPGYHGHEQAAEFLHAQADAIGYPVLIKASAGGGGKGMRRVDRSEDFIAALASCQREAASSFGNDHVLVEKYVLRPRHIEIQVFGDTHGNVVYLNERDCSVQRRHQKVLEEAPAPGMSAERRAAMGKAAADAARAVGYVGAGTVEFIAAQSGEFYFMEMNTRLQVEHPVTEMITGLDLVEWQLRVAAGDRLPLSQAQVPLIGHAIEARIYAEDPDRGFLPSIGTAKVFEMPTGEGVRVDTGIEAGDAVTPFYDPMLAKLIVHGADRDEALARMRQALAQTAIVGLSSNVGFLSRLVAAEGAFARADLDTSLIEREHEALFPATTPATARQIALASVAQLLHETKAIASADPWSAHGGWRLHGQTARELRWRERDELRLATAWSQEASWRISVDGVVFDVSGAFDGSHLDACIDGERVRILMSCVNGVWHLFDHGQHRILQIDDPLAHADSGRAHGGDLAAPMPGKIIALLAEPGPVKAGAALLVMEAMKMEHTITAPADGQLEGFRVTLGEQVDDGAVLVDFTPAGASP
ncbi:MAG: acetyl/propionyl/methylcrotonyl-CoA carboxylase subunit alpha [Xanthomonadales bacterium]|nr:acetyl/propionyl/methylcrotonyl-CoA carboxylase subunit alpha [Xanthomonadales bacterium]